MNLFATFNTIGTIALVLYNLSRFKEKRLLLSDMSRKGMARFKTKAGIWVFFEIILISAVQYYFASFFNNIVGDLVNTGSNYYGILLSGPLMVTLLCLLIKVDPLAQMDLITPAYPLALIFVKIACFFGGCCRGVPWEHGFYNPISRGIEFPSQLLESGVALLLFVALHLTRKKFKKGTLFPIYMMIYSAVRFFTEFTRVEPVVFLGLKTYQIICIVGIAIGAAEYFLARKFSARSEG